LGFFLFVLGGIIFVLRNLFPSLFFVVFRYDVVLSFFFRSCRRESFFERTKSGVGSLLFLFLFIFPTKFEFDLA